MRKWFFLLVVAVGGLASGCATIKVFEAPIVLESLPKSEQERADERLNLRLAKYFAVLSCPGKGTFKEFELNNARDRIFKTGKESEWINIMGKLIQELSEGEVHATKGKTEDFGVFEGRRISIKVFSLERSRIYTIYERRDDVYCDPPIKEYFLNSMTGG